MGQMFTFAHLYLQLYADDVIPACRRSPSRNYLSRVPAIPYAADPLVDSNSHILFIFTALALYLESSEITPNFSYYHITIPPVSREMPPIGDDSTILLMPRTYY
jgi:hypothetical protein